MANNRFPEEVIYMLPLYYWGKDGWDRDVYIADANGKLAVVVDVTNRFLHDESATDGLYWAYPKNEPYNHEPDYPVNLNKWDVFRSKYTWEQFLSEQDWRWRGQFQANY